MRILIIPALVAGLAPSMAAAQEASTTRIEPRAFYGATVTLEEGVRVFRPLPPHRHVVINPGHKTPVNISLEDKVEHTTSTNYNYNYDRTGGGHGGGGGGGGLGFQEGIPRAPDAPLVGTPGTRFRRH